MRYLILISFLIFFTASCHKEVVNPAHEIVIDSVFVNDEFAANGAVLKNVNYEDVIISIKLSEAVDTSLFDKSKFYITNGVGTSYTFYFDRSSQKLSIAPDQVLSELSLYRLIIDPGRNMGGTIYYSYLASFRTRLDTTPKFPKISDDSLLTLVQKKTFGYFWDHAHPVSGLSRERFGSGDIVTSGGSGFGLMAILVGIERGFITRGEGFARLNTTVNFLLRSGTDRFHGAFPHWLNGATGKVIPFSSNDNGGDLVETAFLMQGLITVREYFRNGTAGEKAMCDSITRLWEEIDWNWYRKESQNILYWHWSPDKGWIMNMGISGWNEALIIYVLAASSPTASIPLEAYTQGWARNGSYPMLNNKVFYGIQLPLGQDYGGPLFFAHYSFLGLDPRNLADQYASYWTQNVAHTMINHEYCKTNPKGFAGYADNCWGLTASDIPDGYTASSPTNDHGVIAPTAALSSFPYTPLESMKALKFFYYTIGDRMWGQYGFYDAFSLTSSWFANSYIAIDQGPIVCMIENYRTGILWDTFMSSEEIQAGLDKLGFTY
ncbi:MAG TPA: glucoamylase family protein [Bacteroidales bacterium]|nr:glucoamylase family protein [Bacteroidales bacterium]